MAAPPPLASLKEVVRVMSMHEPTAGDGHRYLTGHVPAGDAGLDAGAPLTAYYEQTGYAAGRSYGEGFAGFGDATRWLPPGDVVTEAAMTAVFRDGVDLVTDDALGRPYSRCDDAKRRAVVGHDPTHTAPKSVSVAWVRPTARPASSSITHIGRCWRHRVRHRPAALGADSSSVRLSALTSLKSCAHPNPRPLAWVVQQPTPAAPSCRGIHSGGGAPGLHSPAPRRLTLAPPSSADGPVAGL